MEAVSLIGSISPRNYMKKARAEVVVTDNNDLENVLFSGVPQIESMFLEIKMSVIVSKDLTIFPLHHLRLLRRKLYNYNTLPIITATT